ncbi:hypothetical protein Godav_015094, partial [Gossypium davidsonii]|nr:hypothetical protein [Gossypium davidsonii]
LQGETGEARVRDTKRGEEEGGDNGEGRREKREELPIDSLLGSQYCRRLGKQLWGRSGLKINDGEEVAWKIDVDVNDPGSRFGVMHRKNNHIPDPFVVEAMLAVQVLEFANEMGFSNIELEGDSLTRIKN